MSNKITAKSYLFLVLIFPLMFILAIINFFMSNILLVSLFAFTTIISGALLIIFKPEKKIKIKYGQKILLDIG